MDQQEFEDHPLWSAEETTSNLLNETADRLTDEAVEDFDVINNLRFALADVRSLRKVDAWRVTTSSPLDNLNAVLDQLCSTLVTVKESPTVSHRIDLERARDQLVDALSPFPLYLVQTEGAQETKQALIQQREFLKETVDWLHQAVNESENSVDKFKANLGANEKKIIAQESRLDEMVNAQGATFADQLSKWKKDSDESAAAIVSAGERHLAILRDFEMQSRNLLDATSRNTITAEYGHYAGKQERAAFWWSVGAVVIALVGFGYLAFILAGVETTSVPEIILKATISSLLVLGSGFMTHESSGHRKEARDARRTQLDLNALDPFLTKLDETEANELRREFAQKIFGRPLANDKSQKPYEWFLNKVRREDRRENEQQPAESLGEA